MTSTFALEVLEEKYFYDLNETPYSLVLQLRIT